MAESKEELKSEASGLLKSDSDQIGGVQVRFVTRFFISSKDEAFDQ